jgi:PAS domain S-box-containing protein
MERLSGWTQREAAGRPHEEICPLVNGKGRPLEAEERFLARAISSRRVVASRGYDVSRLTRDGRQTPVGIAAAPIFDEEGELLGGVDVLRDVAHEREVDQMKSSLISTVSHELRTPLTMIQGFSELLLTKDVDEKNVQEALDQINVSARRLGRLIEDLLSVSRIESGRLDAHLAPVDLVQAVVDVSALFDRKRRIQVEIDDNLPPVLADGEMLIRILTNLLSNAVKYSPSDSSISVTARQIHGSVEVAVSDTGIGLTDAEIAHLFDKFFRADRPEVRAAGGTGLGLYITRNLVEMQGGQIWVESELGRGTTFRFTLPLATHDAPLVSI